MLHSGSPGFGNKIGRHFIEKAKRDMERKMIHLPDKDLAYIPEGSEHFDNYVAAVERAQNFARVNREVMMSRTLGKLRSELGIDFTADLEAVNCHHNYIRREYHWRKRLGNT